MIIYGSKAISIRTGKIRNISCPDCQSETTMRYEVFAKYGHLYWIPFFPIGRVTITECDHCKKTTEFQNLPDTIQKKLLLEKDRNPIRTPIWFFSGIALTAVLIGWIAYEDNQDDELSKQYIAAPKIGDIYRIRTDTGNFSTFKIEKVFQDSLYLYANDMETNMESSIDEINVAQNYKEMYSFALKDLRKMFKEEKIYQIDRP